MATKGQASRAPRQRASPEPDDRRGRDTNRSKRQGARADRPDGLRASRPRPIWITPTGFACAGTRAAARPAGQQPMRSESLGRTRERPAAASTRPGAAALLLRVLAVVRTTFGCALARDKERGASAEVETLLPDQSRSLRQARSPRGRCSLGRNGAPGLTPSARASSLSPSTTAARPGWRSTQARLTARAHVPWLTRPFRRFAQQPT